VRGGVYISKKGSMEKDNPLERIASKLEEAAGVAAKGVIGLAILKKEREEMDKAVCEACPAHKDWPNCDEPYYPCPYVEKTEV